MRRKTIPTRLIDTHVGRQLRVLRASRGFSQEALAEKIGISYQQLHKYETGSNSISASRLYELSKFLGISPDTFFEGLGAEIISDNDLPDSLLSRNQMGLLKYFSSVPEHKRGALLGFIKSMSEENQ